MRILGLAFMVCACQWLSAQVIEDLSLRIDTSTYAFSTHSSMYQSEKHLVFAYDSENPVVQVSVALSPEAIDYEIYLLPTRDFDVIDSLVIIGQEGQFKVRFKQLSSSEFLRFSFIVKQQDITGREEFPLLPIQSTYALIYPDSEELFIGEESVFEVVTGNPNNLQLDYRWKEGNSFNHRFSQQGNQVFLHLIPTEPGVQDFEFSAALNKPRLDPEDSLQFRTEPHQNQFFVKEGILVFLKLDKQEITPREDRTEAIALQIDNHRNLQLGRTYRIENQEEPGGPLIAELFTKTRLNNDKVLADLRVYAMHRKSEGYLYIKEGDQPRFVTNVDITPKTKINSIEIQREGLPWTNSNHVYPGEQLIVRLKGEGLHKSKISFQGASDLTYDSLVRNEHVSLFKIKIPKNVSTRNIEIYNYTELIGQSLRVQEYQEPRALDFVSLDVAGDEYIVDQIDKPIYFSRNLTDLVLGFDRSKIDGPQGFFGKQYLSVDVKISNKDGNLIEIYKFDEVVIGPGESSPRYAFYERSDEYTGAINLNNYLTRKTHSLEEWSKIELEVSHVKDKHGGKGEKQRIQIYLKREYNFDVDLSFPAGLLILEANRSDEEAGFINFGGPSFAMMAQFSFYQEGRIAKYRPYKVGAGFIAIDAFNLTGNGNQDIGVVVMGSLHPTKSGKKLTFPLYAGFGYFLIKQSPFFLLGPGIRVRL